MTGVVKSVSAWLTISPPTIVMPSGWRSSEPTPQPIISGSAPSSAAIVVIMIGRKRSRHGLEDRVAGRELAVALGVDREVDHHDGVFLHDADQEDDADDGDHARSRCP